MSDTPTPQPQPDVDPTDVPYEHEEHEEHEEFTKRTTVPDDFDPEGGDDNEED